MQRTTKRRLNKDSGDLRNWAGAKEHIGHELKTFYERCMTDELPPRLREVLKKLEEETETSAPPPSLIRDKEN